MPEAILEADTLRSVFMTERTATVTPPISKATMAITIMISMSVKPVERARRVIHTPSQPRALDVVLGAGLLVGPLGRDVEAVVGVGGARAGVQELLVPRILGRLVDVLLRVQLLQRLGAALARVVDHPVLDGRLELADLGLAGLDLRLLVALEGDHAH